MDRYNSGNQLKIFNSRIEFRSLRREVKEERASTKKGRSLNTKERAIETEGCRKRGLRILGGASLTQTQAGESSEGGETLKKRLRGTSMKKNVIT